MAVTDPYAFVEDYQSVFGAVPIAWYAMDAQRYLFEHRLPRETLASVAVSLDNGPGRRMLVVQLGSQDYALLMCALVFVALGRVMGEAARLARENEGFV